MPLLLALLKTLTITKIHAWICSAYAYIMGRFCQRLIAPHPSPFVTIEPTNYCNLSCPECATGSNSLKREKGNMTLSTFTKIIDEIAPYTIVLNLYMQGEPYLNKHLPEMIAYAKRKNIFVSLSTNANVKITYHKDELPQHMVLSVDGLNQEVYEYYRVGGSFNKVEKFIRSLSEWKKRNKTRLPYIEMQYLLHRANENVVNETRIKFHGMYNRFVTKTMQIIHQKNRDHFSPTQKKDSRYNHINKIKRSCYKMLSSSVFTQDGTMVPCCMDKDATYVLGNIKHDSYQNILKNQKSYEFHKQLLSHKANMNICSNCPFA